MSLASTVKNTALSLVAAGSLSTEKANAVTGTAPNDWRSFGATPALVTKPEAGQNVQFVANITVEEARKQLRDAKKNEGEVKKEAVALDHQITAAGRSKNEDAKKGAVDEFLKAAKDPVKLDVLQKGLPMDVKIELLATKALTDPQRKELAESLFTKRNLEAAAEVKKLLTELQKPGAVISEKTLIAISTASQPSADAVSTLLKYHPELKTEKTPAAILAGVYSANSAAIDADKKTSALFARLTREFSPPKTN